MLKIPIPDTEHHLAVRLDESAGEGSKGRAVLYLHGFGSSQEAEKAEFFRRRALEAGMSFCSLDFRGHGASDDDLEGLTLTRNVEDADLALQQLEERGYPPPVVLGSSFGALTGLWLSALHPDRVAAGLYIAPALDLEERTRSWAGEEGLAAWREAGRVRVATPVVETDLGWDFLADFERYTPAELSRRLATPSLLLQGQRDDQVGWERVAAFAAACDRTPVELHLFSDGDHRLLDRKALLWELMSHFLARQGFPR
ncbi:MAG: alpha/beta hydrolase [Acidobacteriota bacterium]|nr:alpha/beta hydrolase [Acidobacteriota bacterium]